MTVMFFDAAEIFLVFVMSSAPRKTPGSVPEVKQNPWPCHQTRLFRASGVMQIWALKARS